VRVFERLDEIPDRFAAHALQRSNRRCPDAFVAAPERFKAPFQWSFLGNRLFCFGFRHFLGDHRDLKFPGLPGFRLGNGFLLGFVGAGDLLFKLKRNEQVQRDRTHRG
jgi:hypothetical protein